MTIVHRPSETILLRSRKTASSSIEIFLISETMLGEDIYVTSRETRHLELPKFRRQMPVPPGQSLWWVQPPKAVWWGRRNVRGFHRLCPLLVQHDSARRVRRLLGGRFFDRALKIVPVRNPWDAIVSYYHWDRTGGQGRSFPVDMSWNDWLRLRLSPRKSLGGLCDAQHFLFYDHMFIKGRPINAEPIFFEAIDESLERIGKRMSTEFPSFSASGLHLKKSVRKSDYREQFTDAQAADVERLFDDFLALTGYSFDEVGKAPG